MYLLILHLLIKNIVIIINPENYYSVAKTRY